MGDGGNPTRGGGGRGEEGRDEAGGGTEGGVEGEGTGLPVDAGVVAGQPREAQDQREVGQADELKGNLFRVGAMDANARVVEVGDGGGRTAVNELHGDGVGVGCGLEFVCVQNRGVQEGARRARVDEGEEGEGEAARNEEMNSEGEVARSGEGEGGGGR